MSSSSSSSSSSSPPPSSPSSLPLSPPPGRLVQPLFVDGKYGNPWDTYEVRGFKHIVKWMTAREAVNFTTAELDEHLPVVEMDWNLINQPDPSEIQCTWIGHATMFVQMEGVNILTDPIFSDRCSMVQFMGPKRIRRTPCKVSDLPKIDAVVISHNHYDHLDANTVKQLGNSPKWFVPKGVKEWFAGMGIDNVVELSWWEEARFSDSLKFVSTPCQHWSKRTAFDDFKALWCSWAIVGTQRKFFFTGDTGYCTGFAEIGQELGPFDLAAIPIGAYCPRWFMKPQHVDPEEAVQIHIDLRSKSSVGMHWGTFVLTDEPIFEPPQKLREACQQKGLNNNDFCVLNIGQMKCVGDN